MRKNYRMASVFEEVVCKDITSSSEDLTQTEIKSLNCSSDDENYSCEEFNSGDDFSIEDEEAEYQSILQARQRRNAIDFSPMDATPNETGDCDSFEYEAAEQDSMGKSTGSSSVCSDEERIVEQPSSSSEEIVQNNSCSSLYETPIAACSEGSSLLDDETFKDSSQCRENESNAENNCSVIDRRHFFWKKHGKARKPLRSTDIFANDIPYYKSFIKPCHSLCNLSIVPSLENLSMQGRPTLCCYSNTGSVCYQYFVIYFILYRCIYPVSITSSVQSVHSVVSVG